MERLKIGKDEVRQATKVLEEYKLGKENFENRIISNEQWWKGRHWEQMRSEKDSSLPEPASSWLFNSLINKHAQAMDNYPRANILPREESDTQTAKILTDILPVILEQNDYEEVYDDAWWYKLKAGTGVKGIFWNPAKNSGLGDIEIKRMNLLNLFWEPGVMDIQDSRNFFSVSLVDNDVLQSMYPQLSGLSGTQSVTVNKYIYDDAVSTENKSLVVDWYYKVRDCAGTKLHYCRYVGDTVLYASENDPLFAERGFYDHGMYPFVFDNMFSEEGTPCGFGYLDIMKDCQMYIDKLDQAILVNTLCNAKPRYFIRSDGSINEEEFADTANTFIHTDMNLGTDSIRPVDRFQLSGNYMSVLQMKIEEIKETSGNKDFMQGGVMGGVSSGTAITALQEAGSKLTRDMIKGCYRAFTKECYIIIELIRQFYTQPRVFRIVGENAEGEFISFDNSALTVQPQGEKFGVDLGSRLPVFDIKVVAQKSNPFTRESQNEMILNLYKLGMFNPENSSQALVAIEAMDFEGKEQMRESIVKNASIFNSMQQLSAQVELLEQQLRREIPAEQSGSDIKLAPPGENGSRTKLKNVLRS